MKKRIMIWIMGAVLVALPTVAQTFGEQQVSIGFQSTSTMTGSGSAYSSTPMLNEDGTATYSGAGGPKRAKLDATPGTPFTPGQGEQGNQFPLGDALLPMMLMAMLFAGFVALRRRKHVKGLNR